MVNLNYPVYHISYQISQSFLKSSETMKLLGNTKNKKTKDGNGKYKP